MKLNTVFILSLFSILIYIQCSEKNNPVQSESQKVMIEAQSGGRVSLDNGISLDIPAGALNENTEIQVEALTGQAFDEFSIIGVQMQPNGLIFNSPATIRLPLPPDWDNNELPAIYEVEGDDPTDFFLTGKQAKIIGSSGAYFAEIEVNHFSSLGAARNCHAGSINYLFNDFNKANCSIDDMKSQVKEIYGDRFKVEPYDKNGIDELFVTNVPIQCFLNTYFNNYGGFENGEPVSNELLQTLKQFMDRDGRQVAVGFNSNWIDADNDGIYEGFAHSAVLELVDGQLKLRQSVSVKDEVIKKVIEKFGENNIYYPQDGELTAALLNEYRGKKSGELFETEICGTPECLWPNSPIAFRRAPYQAVRFYVSKYTRNQNPCEQTSDINYTTCWVKVKLGSVFFRKSPGDGGDSYISSTGGVPLGLITLEGSFADNTFSGFYNEVITNGDNSFTITGSVTAQLNEDQSEVSTVAFSKTTNWVNNTNSSNGSSVENFSANNIPATRVGSSTYTVKHSFACDNISSLSYSRINNVPNNVNSSYSEFIEWYDCNGDSELTVFFSN